MKKFITRILCAALVVAATLALAACSKAETPLTVAELLDLGEKYLLELNYEQALVQFLEVIEVEPRTPRSYTGAAEAYIGLGDTDNAEAVLRKGLEVLPNSAEIIDIARKLGIDVGIEQTPAPTPAPTPTPTPVPTPAPTVGGTIEFGGYDWLILDIQDGKALIITDMVIEERAYHDTDAEVTWETSDIRAYLNDIFLSSFNRADRARIADTNVVNNDNPWRFFDWKVMGNTPGGADTTDKIFLLSLDEVIQYFGDSGMLARGVDGSARDFDLERSNHGIHYWGIHDEYSNARIARDVWQWWWLRSPGASPNVVAYVDHDGGVSVTGLFVNPFDGGIRPALWLILE